MYSVRHFSFYFKCNCFMVNGYMDLELAHIEIAS